MGAKKPGEEGPQDIESLRVMTGVQPFVHDTRDLLLKLDTSSFRDRSEDFLASISYALQRGMQVLFQLEEQEIAVTRIGEAEQRRILFWEAAEGGNGVWPRLLQEPEAVSKIAREALRICHFDPESGKDMAQRRESIVPKHAHDIITAQQAVELVSEHVGVAILTKPTARTLHADGVVVRPLSDTSLWFDTSVIMRAGDESRLVNEFVRSFLRRYAPQRLLPKQMELWLSV